MRKLIVLLILSVVFAWQGCSAPEVSMVEIQNGVELNKGQLSIRVQFYTNKIVRITKWDQKGTSEKKSLAVIQQSIPVLQLTLKENERNYTLSSEALTLLIDKQSGNIQYIDKEKQQLLKEKGKPQFQAVVFEGDSGFSVQQNFELSANEGLYGLGQHQDGAFNYRGKKVTLVQSNTEAVNPFLVSTANYGLLWDNYSMTIFNDEKEEASFWSEMGDNIDYYFVHGDNIDQLIAGYRYLTGTAPMYGKYAFGYWQSKEHYDTQEELLAVARKYRELNIPIDNMIQDWDYWNGAENWSGMFFDKTLFPEPEKMMEELHAMNYHAIISIWPALGSNTEIYKDMGRKGYLYNPVGWAGFKYYDVYHPGANDLYWKYLHDGIYTKGLDGWWIDSTEPDVINALSKEATAYELKKMGSNYLGSFARYLNTFSLVMTDDIYRYWRETTSERRAYILTRSCFAGQQRNAATTWSGDIGASWEIYRKQISAGLNHSMAGIPYWTFDIGAFLLGSYGGVFYKGGNDPAYHELYTRMFQLGAFSPIFRSHGSDTPREMWEMGEYLPVLIQFDRLRYRLLPYIYSLAWKVTSGDYTLMRGLPMDFSNDEKTYNIDDQFLFGPGIMVCPVSSYMYHRPPATSTVVAPAYFKTADGKQGLAARYYTDNEYRQLSRESIDPNIDMNWYGGRPAYVTDSMYAIRWEGQLLPPESGIYQFHMKSFDSNRIYIDGQEVPIAHDGNEKYSAFIELEAGKACDFVAEVENKQTGAARMQLFWKTPSMLAQEQEPLETEKSRKVYLPQSTLWYDFWTGRQYEGGQELAFDAPIDRIPLLIKAGTILPMGPVVQYATEKPADPLEIRIYPGADGHFSLYEDENDNYNYEKGIYSTIDFHWNDQERTLSIDERKGEFPGMLIERNLQIVVVDHGKGSGIAPSEKIDQQVKYIGKALKVAVQ